MQGGTLILQLTCEATTYRVLAAFPTPWVCLRRRASGTKDWGQKYFSRNLGRDRAPRGDFYEGYSPGDKSTTTKPKSFKISEIAVWHQILMLKKFWHPDFSEIAFCWLSKWSHFRNCKISKVCTQKFDRSDSAHYWHPHHYIFTVYCSADTSYRPDFLSALDFWYLADCKISNVWNFAILQLVDLHPGEHAEQSEDRGGGLDSSRGIQCSILRRWCGSCACDSTIFWNFALQNSKLCYFAVRNFKNRPFSMRCTGRLTPRAHIFQVWMMLWAPVQQNCGLCIQFRRILVAVTKAKLQNPLWNLAILQFCRICTVVFTSGAPGRRETV